MYILGKKFSGQADMTVEIGSQCHDMELKRKIGEIRGNEKVLRCRSSVNDHERVGMDVTSGDELIRYMSNLPSYLERGLNIQERAFNVGVLDWGHLEKWQHSHKWTLFRTSSDFVSNNDCSSSFIIDGSSSYSRRDQNHCPLQRRMGRHTQKSCSVSSKVPLKSFKDNAGKFHDRGISDSCFWNKELKTPGTDQTVEHTLENRAERSMRKYLHSAISRKNEIPNTKSSKMPRTLKEKVKTRESGPQMRNVKREGSNDSAVCRELIRSSDLVIALPHDDISEESQICDSTKIFNERLEEASQGRSRDQCSNSKSSSGIPCIGPLPFELDCSRRLPVKQHSSIYAGPVIDNSERSVSENDPASVSLERSIENSTCSRSSPLRRLLDPILKPGTESLHQHTQLLPESSVSTKGVNRPCKGLPDSSKMQPVKGRLSLIGCRTVDVWNSAPGKGETPAVQALLRVAFKNGRPLFTFAVSNESDVLAATIKKFSSSRKEQPRWIYTLYKVPTVKKKKISRMKGGCKVEGQHYVPSVVAQMHVSDCHSSKATRQREYALFSAELGQANSRTSHFQPNDELAAIVCQIPLGGYRSSYLDECQGNTQNELLETDYEDCSVGLGSTFTDGKTMNDKLRFVKENLISTTVILPSGVHSLPRKGEPSSLIERWRSGGLCDCGGWDLGCRLRIISNQNHLSGKSTPSKAASSIDKLMLFTQVDDQRQQPVFSLAPSMDGIYSIEFHSSLSELQAFAICIAVVDSRSLSHLEKQGKNVSAKT